MELSVRRGLPVPVRDGIVLQADLYRPAGADRLPTLLLRTPYHRGAPGFGGSLDPRRLVEAGFNLLVQDVRGRYGSGGRWEPYLHEGEDGAATVEWAAGQPWSTPAVGMVGRSYAGLAQWLAAAAAPAALRALAPEVAAAEPYEGWTYGGGAFHLGFCLGWVLEDLACRGGEPLRVPPAEVAEACARPASILPLLDELAPYYRQWLEHPAFDGYWRARGAGGRGLDRVAAPSLSVGGWFDPFLPGTLAAFARVRRGPHAEVRERSRLVIGPWGHLARDGVFADRRFAGAGLDLTALNVRWFRRHLREHAGGEDGPAVQAYVMGADAWRVWEDWPPPGMRRRRLYLRPEGRLGPRPASGGGVDAYRYDPAHPVPTWGGPAATEAMDGCAGPRDQRALDGRTDVRRYATPPLREPVAIAGEVRAVLFASSTAPGTDFTARLVDVAPDGRELALCDGIVRVGMRDGSGRIPPLASGRVQRVVVRAGSTANVFLPGHRIRLDVSSSNAPRFDPNPNTGDRSVALGTARTVVARNAVHHGSAHPSHLELPVIPWPG